MRDIDVDWLPWPSSWKLQKAGKVGLWTIVVFDAIGIAIAAIGIRAALDGDVDRSALILAFSFMIVFAATCSLVPRIRQRDGSTPITFAHIQGIDQSGVVFRYVRRGGGGLVVLSISFLPMTVILTLGAGLHTLDPTARDLTSIFGFVFFGLCTLVLVVALTIGIAEVAYIKNERRLLAFTTAGIYNRGPRWAAFFPWDELFTVRDVPIGLQRIQFSMWDIKKIYLEDYRRFKYPKIKPESAENTGLDAGEVAVANPALLFWGIKFYHENRNRLAELSSEAGVDRFRQADFPCDQEESTYGEPPKGSG